MPCYTETPQDRADALKREADKVTDMLCRVMTVLEVITTEDGIRAIMSIDKDVIDWWVSHKLWDERRKAAARQAEYDSTHNLSFDDAYDLAKTRGRPIKRKGWDIGYTYAELQDERLSIDDYRARDWEIE